MAKLVMKRYKSKDVAEAIGESVSSLRAYASSHNRSTKNGWTIPEIVEFLERPHIRVRGSRPIDEKDVEEIRSALVCFGYKVSDHEQMKCEQQTEDEE